MERYAAQEIARRRDGDRNQNDDHGRTRREPYDIFKKSLEMNYMLLATAAIALGVALMLSWGLGPRKLEDGVKTVVQFAAPFDHPNALEDGISNLQSLLLTPSQWLHALLLDRIPGIQPPEFVDYGYSLSCSAGSRDYNIDLSFDFHNWKYFEISLGPSFSRFFGGYRSFHPRHEQKELAQLASAIHNALEEQEEVSDIRWFDWSPEGPDWPFAPRPDETEPWPTGIEIKATSGSGE